MKTKNETTIEELLIDNPRGLTIQEIADKSKITRNTALIILAKLFGQDKIEIREVGQSKLHYWKYKKLPKIDSNKEILKQMKEVLNGKSK